MHRLSQQKYSERLDGIRTRVLSNYVLSMLRKNICVQPSKLVREMFSKINSLSI